MKPQWLKDLEKEQQVVHRREFDKCVDCLYYGRLLHYTRHKGKETVGVHKCEMHPGCLNTCYSIVCDDFIPNQLL